MFILLLSCVVLLGLSILTASPDETHQKHKEDFVPEEYFSEMI